ncbi:hypothetical protein D3C84_951620 [compost metagenome]
MGRIVGNRVGRIEVVACDNASNCIGIVFEELSETDVIDDLVDHVEVRATDARTQWTVNSSHGHVSESILPDFVRTSHLDSFIDKIIQTVVHQVLGDTADDCAFSLDVDELSQLAIASHCIHELQEVVSAIDVSSANKHTGVLVEYLDTLLSPRSNHCCRSIPQDILERTTQRTE